MHILELPLPALLHDLHLHVLVHDLIGHRIVPLPLQIHRLTLLLSHQVDLKVLVGHQGPLLGLTTVHDGIDGVVLLPAFEFGLGGVEVECVFELNTRLPAVLGGETTGHKGITLAVVLPSLCVLREEVMDVDVFALMELQELHDICRLGTQALQLDLLGSKHQLTSQAPCCTLGGTMDQLVGTGVFALEVVLQLLSHFVLEGFLHCLIVTQWLDCIIQLLLQGTFLRLFREGGGRIQGFGCATRASAYGSGEEIEELVELDEHGQIICAAGGQRRIIQTKLIKVCKQTCNYQKMYVLLRKILKINVKKYNNDKLQLQGGVISWLNNLMQQILLLRTINGPKSQLTNKNYKQTTDQHMQSLDRTEYLSKIEQIRMRIQSKQTQRDTRPKLYEQLGQYGQNTNTTLKIDPQSIIDDLSKRRPLESVQNKTNQFQERVKELDSVSERIKALLSNKRTPSSLENKPKPFIETPKSQKITSLFQKDLLFSESKVGEGLMGGIQYRNLVSTFKERLNESSIPVNLTQTSRIFTTYPEYRPQSKVEVAPPPQPVPAFDAETFKKRFINQISKDPSRDKLIPQVSQRSISVSKEQSIVQSTRQQSKSIKPSTSSHTKQLLQCLSRQIQLEGKLRACKEKFDAFRAENKMDLLKEEARKRGIRLSEREIEEWVIIEEEEFDPFVSLVFTRDFDFSDLLGRLAQAKKHWEEQVRGCVARDELEKQQFKDHFRRGSISLQDLVCFVNLQRGCFLKNRDLFSLFKHLMFMESSKLPSQHRIKMDTFLAFVGR